MQSHPLPLMILAIMFELVGTTSLKIADGGAKPIWYIPVGLAYGGAMYLFSLAIRVMPLGVAYALWAGLGIVGTAVIGAMLFRQHLSLSAMAGIAFILLGAFLVNMNPAGVR